MTYKRPGQRDVKVFDAAAKLGDCFREHTSLCIAGRGLSQDERVSFMHLANRMGTHLSHVLDQRYQTRNNLDLLGDPGSMMQTLSDDFMLGEKKAGGAVDTSTNFYAILVQCYRKLLPKCLGAEQSEDSVHAESTAEEEQAQVNTVESHKQKDEAFLQEYEQKVRNAYEARIEQRSKQNKRHVERQQKAGRVQVCNGVEDCAGGTCSTTNCAASRKLLGSGHWAGSAARRRRARRRRAWRKPRPTPRPTSRKCCGVPTEDKVGPQQCRDLSGMSASHLGKDIGCVQIFEDMNLTPLTLQMCI